MWFTTFKLTVEIFNGRICHWERNIYLKKSRYKKSPKSSRSDGKTLPCIRGIKWCNLAFEYFLLECYISERSIDRAARRGNYSALFNPLLSPFTLLYSRNEQASVSKNDNVRSS